MKTTTTIYNIIHSELIKNGHNEFFNKGQMTMFDDEFAFIKKAMDYDKDVEEIVNNTFFRGLRLENKTHDNLFKRNFINKFLHRQIAFQTVEIFSTQVLYTFMSNYDYITKLYDNLDDYIDGKYFSETKQDGKETGDTRQLESTLPQNEINLNVDDTVLNYGDNNMISRNKNVNEGKSNTQSSQKNLDNLIKTNTLIEEILLKFDINCFMQIW